MPPKKQVYTKKDPISHVLDRPDTWVGSVRSRNIEEFVVLDDAYHIDKRTINVSPAIIRMFIEPLSNIVDNVARSKLNKNPTTKIEIDIDKESGQISFWNDGDVVPVERHETEKCYNHTMIFGQLLTGSNYDDTQEREDISGRNGVGGKACLIKGSLVPTFSGNYVKVEDIRIGDMLIGDDGNPRKVLDTVEGNGKMYEISQSRGKSYVVNENHILTVKMADHKVIFWNTAKSGWSVLWLDKKTKKIHMKSISSSMPKIICPECKTNLTGNITRHYRRVHPGKEYTSERLKPTITPPDTEKNKKAKQELEKFISEIPDDNTLDISVKEYMNMTPTTRSRFSGFIGQCVQWEEKPVDIDPYVLGLWLGDGYHTGYGFVVNWEKDPEILDYLNKWGENNDMIFRKLKRPIEFHIDGTKRKAPFKALLQKYNLVKNKHIPKDYLVNSRKNRLALLAGIIDTDGTVQSDGTRIIITQGLNHTQLAKDIVFLAKSLGFTCSTHIMKTQWTHKGELRRGTAINMNISGAGVEDIPTRLPRKKCVAPSKKDVSNTGSLKIRQVEDADFVGFQVDGNNRFLLEDFTVTHNCNIFSKTFTVEGADPDNKKLFRQTWTNNMRNPSEPVISPYKEKKGYTKVFYRLDFARFGVEGYTDDIISLYKRLAVDASMVTKVPLFWNGEEIPVHSLVDYAKLFSGDEAETLFIKTKDCEVVISSSSEGESQTISFANGIYTPSGGTHVEAWSEAIFRPLIDKLNKPKKPQVNIGDVKKFFRLFVVATVKNPEFDSQSKFKLEAPQITAEVKKSHIATISRWTVMDRLEDIIRAKEMVVLKKAERKKRGYEKVEGLEPANNEGGSKSTECTLILVEGLSAKTYASWGIQRGAFGKKGRDWFGIFPLRGKVLNCRNAKPVTISKNKIVTDIIKALGIQYDLDYSIEENYKKLRYGRVMIICDADVDGHHISGLIQNMFHALFPTLLKRQVPFLTSMQTPIVRVYLGKTDKLFYDEQEYRKYVKTLDGKKINKKYYKGLGSSNEDDVAETFGQKLIEYKEDDHTFENMNKAFNTKFSDMRKEWLEHYDSSQTVLKWDGNKEEKLAITFSDYINTELIKFSLDDCKRSIPNIMDGLKEGHRKVLYVCFLNNIKHTGKTIKVAQLAGMVSHKAGYHHGEQNLEATMTHMANAYVGSNNIPLLFRDGQFGSRAENGDDAAAGRYIWTKLDAMTRYIFREEDDMLLDYIEDDGDKVEPKFYVPIIPMILINGMTGIGTGWSSSIPSYNPLDIISAIKVWINNGHKAFDLTDDISISLLPELTPWYRGHTGDMTSEGDGKYTTWGRVDLDNKGKAHVSELPVGMSTSSFVDFLEEMKENKHISNYKNHSTPKDISFTITESSEGISCDVNNLKLFKHIRTTNMVAFTENGAIKKFNSAEEIIDSFCQVRYLYYVKRKERILKNLDRTIKILGNKKRFLQEVRDGIFKLFEDVKGKRQSRKTVDIIKELEQTGYDRDTDGEETEEEDGDENRKGYEYLLRLQISSITAEKIDKLHNDIASNISEREELKATSEDKLWIRDLEEFENEYVKWLPVINNEKQKKKR